MIHDFYFITKGEAVHCIPNLGYKIFAIVKEGGTVGFKDIIRYLTMNKKTIHDLKDPAFANKMHRGFTVKAYTEVEALVLKVINLYQMAIEWPDELNDLIETEKKGVKGLMK